MRRTIGILTALLSALAVGVALPPGAGAGADPGAPPVERPGDDSSLRFHADGQPYYVDPVRPTVGQRNWRPSPAARALADEFDQLHSRPGSSRTILLDIDGAEVKGTGWNEPANGQPGMPEKFYAGWDPARNGATFNAIERALVVQVWQGVAEDFAPFDVDVTTEDPGFHGIHRSGPGDLRFGTRVLLTNDQDAQGSVHCHPCAGVANQSVFDATEGHAYHQPTWVFPGYLDGPDGFSFRGVVDTVSHEVGHNLNLRHDGKGSEEYYEGHDPWAPIMGGAWDQPVQQWSNGDYGGTEDQDDIAVIARQGAPLLPDDAGDTIGSAAPLPGGPAVITTRDDQDVYALGRCSGEVTIDAQPAPESPNLDIELRLADAEGQEQAPPADPPVVKIDEERAGGLDAQLSATLEEGLYYLRVDGVGAGPAATSYSDYGSVGSYTLTVTGCDTEAATTVPTAPRGFVANVQGDGVTLSWTAPADDGGAPIEEYVVQHPGGQTVTEATSVTLPDLAPNTVNRLAVRAVNAVGVGPAVQLEVWVSAAGRPGRPELTRVRPGKPGGKATASLRWRAPANSEVDGYRLRAWKIGRNGRVVKKVTSGWKAATPRASTFTGKRGERYTFAVRARNDAGAGPWSARSSTVRLR